MFPTCPAFSFLIAVACGWDSVAIPIDFIIRNRYGMAIKVKIVFDLKI